MKRAGQKDVVILAAKRTPFGTFGGALKDLTATDLAVHAAKAALAQAGVPAEDFGHVVIGNVAQTRADAIYLARHVGLRAGLPDRRPGAHREPALRLGVRGGRPGGACSSQTGEAEVVLAGGTESMSQAPLVLRGTRWGFPFGKPPPIEDMLWSALTDSYAGLPMALTAEKLAEQYRIAQDEVDEYAVLVAAALGGGARGGALRGGARAGRGEGEEGPRHVRARRAPAARTRRVEGLAEAPEGVQEGRRHPRGRGERHLRRRGRARRSRRARTRSGTGVTAARAARELGPRRRRSDDHGHRPGAGDPERARARRGEARGLRPRSR